MDDAIKEIVTALTQYLLSGNTRISSGGEMHYRDPLDPIVCRDGSRFSIQVGDWLYCKPKNSVGPWEEVEVMSSVKPYLWEADDNGIGAYVPIELVAQEIYMRGAILPDPTLQIEEKK